MLLLWRGILHAGVGRDRIGGLKMCDDLWAPCHPLFTDDPNFSPLMHTDHRHAYALAAFRLNDGSTCRACFGQLTAAGLDPSELAGLLDVTHVPAPSDGALPSPGGSRRGRRP